MYREDVVYIYNGILFNHKKELNLAIFGNMDGAWGHCAKWNKLGRERQINTMWPLLYVESRKYNNKNLKIKTGGPSRWRKSKTRRSPSSPQIHQKYIYLWNNSYRTPTECWQKTSNLPKGKKLPTYLGRAKEIRKNRDKRIGTGPVQVGGSCLGGKVSTH